MSNDWIEGIKKILDFQIVTLGSAPITLWTLIYLLVFSILLLYLSGKLRTWLTDDLLTRTKLGIGARQAAGTIIRYLVIVIGFVIILQTAGIDLTALNVLAGAVGIGVGFGLQNIVNNFVSGLIILFERPIQVGDRIVVGDVEGDVVHIGGRSTTVISNDNISIIVPNSKFISENIINWSHSDPKVRFRVPVAVAYGSDARLVEKILLEVAAANQDVLATPGPAVRLMKFGDNGLQFELRAWSSTRVHQKGTLISALNFAIYEKFAEHGIEIPFPQRDLRIRGGSMGVVLSEPDQTS